MLGGLGITAYYDPSEWVTTLSCSKDQQELVSEGAILLLRFSSYETEPRHSSSPCCPELNPSEYSLASLGAQVKGKDKRNRPSEVLRDKVL